MILISATFHRVLAAGAGFCFLSAADAQLNERVLHSFNGGSDGQQPYAGLVQGADGALYGTTYLGGTNNAGTVFKVNPDGSGNTPIYHFGANNVDPFGLAYPSGLIQGADGALYGTTGFGGAAGNGSVFRLNPDGTGYTIFHSFSLSGGYEPTAALVQCRDGTLFGTTQAGGSGGAGTVFRISTNGTGFVQLYDFGLRPGDPQSPQAPLLQGADGALYGTTSAGGASAVGGASGYGTVFKINPDGTGAAVVHSFMPSGGDGQRPYASLVQGSDGALYGTTQEGGSLANGGSSGVGTVFKLNPDGSSYTILHSFDAAPDDGRYPNSALAAGNDGALYGTTEYGGSSNVGAVFKLSLDGSDYSLLYSFGSNPGDGSYPKAPLLRASDGGLFGTAQFGGENNDGTIFRLGPAPALISLIRSAADKTVRLSITSAPHFEYHIEGSSDRLHWLLLTNMYNAAGTMQFTDPDASKFPIRFYRAAWVP
jgi:uncharacterized repeat protein (TIGR03803 family)